MTSFVQITIDGILRGGLLALISIGFSLVWGLLNTVNLAHGAFVIVGAYLAFQLREALGLHPFAGAPLVALCLFGLGYTLHRFVIARVTGGPTLFALPLTFAIHLFLTNAITAIYSSDYRSIDMDVFGRIRLGAVVIPGTLLLAFAISLVSTLLLGWLIHHTRTGLVVMATGIDGVAARLAGINIRRISALTFGIGAALAGVGGATVAAVGTFSPADATTYLTDCFVVSLIGGVRSVQGAFVGGLLVGLVQAWAGYFISTALITTVTFAVLGVVLVFRPLPRTAS